CMLEAISCSVFSICSLSLIFVFSSSAEISILMASSKVGLMLSSLQYLSPTASQVIGQLSPVGMLVASVFILKEKMRGTQVIGAL
ncbi:EamA family transporter, partial [Salmonella enterica subsp. enterica serovar Kentucky]|nr:EamA family transporter [Salmonella enterica subsp. enterica serovar Kentucky]